MAYHRHRKQQLWRNKNNRRSGSEKSAYVGAKISSEDNRHRNNNVRRQSAKIWREKKQAKGEKQWRKHGSKTAAWHGVMKTGNRKAPASSEKISAWWREEMGAGAAALHGGIESKAM